MMKNAFHLASVLAAATSSMPWVPSADAAVLCQKRSGVIVVRTACKKKETPLDLAQFGAVGPIGPKGDQGDPGPAGSIEGAPAAGDLSGSYPAPTIAAGPAPTVVADNPRTATDPCAGPTPQTGVYCGTSTKHWRTAPTVPNRPGIKFWRDRLGAIHISGAAEVSMGSFLIVENVFYLPPDARPAELLSFPIATGLQSGTTEPLAAALDVFPDGLVRVQVNTSSHGLVLIGDVEFRTDN